jgi:hypothetical protein
LDVSRAGNAPIVAEGAPAVVPGDATTLDVQPSRVVSVNKRGSIDPSHAHGIRSFVVEANTSPEELDSGSATDLLPHAPTWLVLESGIDAEGDCSYRLAAETGMSLSGLSPRTLTLKREVLVPIDMAEVRWHDSAELAGDPEVAFITEIPLRLGGPLRVRAGDEECKGGTVELHDVTAVTVTGDDERTAELLISSPADVWVLRGDDSHDVVLVLVWRISGVRDIGFTLRFAGAEAVEEELEADTDDQEFEYEEETDAEGEAADESEEEESDEEDPPNQDV